MEPLVIIIPPNGGSVQDCTDFINQIKQAEIDGQSVIIKVDSPGSCASIINNHFKPAAEAKVISLPEYNQQKFVKFIIENSKSF